MLVGGLLVIIAVSAVWGVGAGLCKGVLEGHTDAVTSFKFVGREWKSTSEREPGWECGGVGGGVELAVLADSDSTSRLAGIVC